MNYVPAYKRPDFVQCREHGPDTAAAIDRLERRGFLSRCGMCAWEITAKGERAYHHATGNGAAYDRMMRQ